MIHKLNKEEIVVSWLKNHGYYRVEKKTHQESFIEADGKMRRMIVAVVSENEIKTAQKEDIRKVANECSREAWLAEVESSKKINWCPLD